MRHPVAIIGAPSSIGIRPYDSGEVRQLDRAPGFFGNSAWLRGSAPTTSATWCRRPIGISRDRPAGRETNREW